MKQDYIPIIFFVFVGLFVPVLTFVLTKFFRPAKPTELKFRAYECGEVPIGDTRIEFNFQYYMFAIIFVVFDLITVFLILWGLQFREFEPHTKLYSLVCIGVFVATLLIGVYYALRKEAKVLI